MLCSKHDLSIRAYLRIINSDALRRILDQPLEQWTCRDLIDNGGRRCLLGVAKDCGHGDRGNYSRTDDGVGKQHPRYFRHGFRLYVRHTAKRFDSLVMRRGLPQAVALVKARALSVLLSRPDATDSPPVMGTLVSQLAVIE